MNRKVPAAANILSSGTFGIDKFLHIIEILKGNRRTSGRLCK